MPVLSRYAQDILTELNSPDGDCPICLLPLAGEEDVAESVSAADERPVKLPCYHCLHRCVSDRLRSGTLYLSPRLSSFMFDQDFPSGGTLACSTVLCEHSVRCQQPVQQYATPDLGCTLKAAIS